MWFEPLTSWIVALFSTGIPILNEKITPTISAEQWANKELQHKDRMSGMSEKEIIRNAERGRYYIPKEIFEAYPVPHKDPSSNKIVIENCELYNDDVRIHGAVLAQKWVKQGKYNLTEKELKITQLQYEKKHLEMCLLISSYNAERDSARIESINKILARSGWDYTKAEAVSIWQKAYDAENKYY